MILLFSDLHIFTHKRKTLGTQRLDDCLQVLDWVFETARKRNIKNILFAGDLFHDRYNIDVFTYHRTYDALAQNTDAHLWLLLGNHDMWFNDSTGISSILPFSSLPNVSVIHQPSRIKIEGHYWDFVPFTHNPLTSLAEFQEPYEYCLGHVALSGAKLHHSTISDVVVEHDGDMTIVDASVFKDYKRTFLGHYHCPQELSHNVEYVGSTLELNFGETLEEKHLILFDQDKDEREYIVNDFSPRHLIIKNEDLGKYNLKNNFVQVITDGISVTDEIHLRKNLMAELPASLQLKRKKKEEVEQGIVENAKAVLYDEDKMAERYIKECGNDGLNDDRLMKICEKICANDT